MQTQFTIIETKHNIYKAGLLKKKGRIIMDFEKTNCPVVKINGVIERGKQYDLDITLPDVNDKIYQFLGVK